MKNTLVENDEICYLFQMCFRVEKWKETAIFASVKAMLLQERFVHFPKSMWKPTSYEK